MDENGAGGWRGVFVGAESRHATQLKVFKFLMAYTYTPTHKDKCLILFSTKFV